MQSNIAVDIDSFQLHKSFKYSVQKETLNKQIAISFICNESFVVRLLRSNLGFLHLFICTGSQSWNQCLKETAKEITDPKMIRIFIILQWWMSFLKTNRMCCSTSKNISFMESSRMGIFVSSKIDRFLTIGCQPNTFALYVNVCSFKS